MRVLIDALSEIDAVLDFASLPPLVARIAKRLLDADHVVIALEREGELLDFGRHGEPTGSPDAWIAPAEQALKHRGRTPKSDASQLQTRADENLFGPIMAVAIRGRDVAGSLYADKLRRAGQFREQDYAIAHLLSEYVALALGRLVARDQESAALNQLAVTLDAIRDGVVSCDERGVITSANAAAGRMLRVATEELIGVQCAKHPALAPLHALVSATPRIDGSLLRLAHGSFVISARPIADDDPSRGYVATLVELDRAQKMAQRLSATRARYTFNDIIGRSPMLEAAVAMAKRAAAIDANVLITGESGTGKEVIAQAIHSAGPRASEPFVGINVAALPRELLEAELFGYEKGAFTGARAEGNPGKFELAGEGTILLDEIGDMPLDMQAKLLRVLQERVITRLGGRQELPVHARVIATTHRDLDQLVDEGKFRMDLLYRLRVLAIGVPALRDRPEDISDLAQSYMLRFAEQQRKRVRELGPRVIDELERYDWPGNVRELANVMEAEVSLIAADAEVLERLATRLVGRFRTASTVGGTGEYRAVAISPADQPIIPLAEVEKRAFLHALDRMNGNVARAAEALGVSKVTFYAKLRSWGMHPKDRTDEEGPTSARWSTRMRAADALSQTGANPIADPLSRTGSGAAVQPPPTPKSRT
jgi:transcriptional regulator with PAS, ATPase and Fis domain